MTDSRPRNDAAMAEILASIRRIVADEDRCGVQGELSESGGDVLVLTSEMRVVDDEGGDFVQTAVAHHRVPEDESAERRVPALYEASRSAAARVPSPEAELSVDEAAVVDIARVVLRDEFEGEFGRNLTEQITQLVRAEVARALTKQDRARD